MTGKAIDLLCVGVRGLKDQLALALPTHISPDKFERAAITAVRNTHDIHKATKSSVFNSCMKAAQDGLIIDGREAALVLFRDQAQYMPMVYGLMKKARQSGEISAIHEPQIVYENDDLILEYGDEPKLLHKPKLDGDRGKVVGAYSVIKLKDGSIQRTFMTAEQINKRKSVSRSSGSSYSPWVKWWDEMAKKTVLRANLKYCPQSTDLENVLENDNFIYEQDEPLEEKPKRKPRSSTNRRPSSLDGVVESDAVDKDYVSKEDNAIVIDPETGEVISSVGDVEEDVDLF